MPSKMNLCVQCLCVAAAAIDLNATLPIAPPGGTINIDGKCFVASDVMILQDTTGSFMDDMPVVHDQIPLMIQEVTQKFPGTLFGIAEFRDKPYFPLGEPNDFCYKLRYGQLTGDADLLQFAWNILQPSGGGDFYEAHLQAGIDIMLDKSVGWRPLIDGAYNLTSRKAGDSSTMASAVEQWIRGSTESAGAHVVVLITDAEPHLPGDMKMCAPGAPGWQPNWYCPQNLPSNPGTIIDGDTSITCKDYDYPSVEQFTEKALRDNFVFLFLTTADVAPFWQKLSEEKLGNPPGFHQIITANSSNIAQALVSALSALSEVACNSIMTTTLPPRTSPTEASTRNRSVTVTSAFTETLLTVTPSPFTISINTTTRATGASPAPPCSNDGIRCDDLVIKIGDSVVKAEIKYQG